MTQVQVENGTAGSDELGDEILCGVQVALYVPPQGTEMGRKTQLRRHFTCNSSHIFKNLLSLLFQPKGAIFTSFYEGFTVYILD